MEILNVSRHFPLKMQIRVFPALFFVSYELSMLRNTISLLLYYISVIQLLENTFTSAGGWGGKIKRKRKRKLCIDCQLS